LATDAKLVRVWALSNTFNFGFLILDFAFLSLLMNRCGLPDLLQMMWNHQHFRLIGQVGADGIALMDLFVVPTLSFRLLYGLLILWHAWRQILWLGVTAAIQRPNGWPGNSLKLAAGRPNTWIAIKTLFIAKFSPGGCGPWAFMTGQLRLAHSGKTGMRNG
jgi:hypothetical protein